VPDEATTSAVLKDAALLEEFEAGRAEWQKTVDEVIRTLSHTKATHASTGPPQERAKGFTLPDSFWVSEMKAINQEYEEIDFGMAMLRWITSSWNTMATVLGELRPEFVISMKTTAAGMAEAIMHARPEWFAATPELKIGPFKDVVEQQKEAGFVIHQPVTIKDLGRYQEVHSSFESSGVTLGELIHWIQATATASATPSVQTHGPRRQRRHVRQQTRRSMCISHTSRKGRGDARETDCF
jgi:hypothetical protein